MPLSIESKKKKKTREIIPMYMINREKNFYKLNAKDSVSYKNFQRTKNTI